MTLSAKTRLRIWDYVSAILPLLPKWCQDDTWFAVLGESDGDACLFNALLATVWPEDQTNWPLKAVIASQDDEGQFYRSPKRAAERASSFSRDMATGVIAAATLPMFPPNSWSRWLDYIDGSRPCSVKKPKWAGGGCLIRSPIYRYAPDDRSAISPECWSMMERVARHRNLRKHSQMVAFEKYDGDIGVLEARECELGYQLHLKAVDAYIKFLVGQSREYSIKVGKIAAERVPDNLFYRFLATREISEDLAEAYFDIAPPLQTAWGNAWVWEKSSVDSHLSKTCGWDFVFLGYLMLKFLEC